MKKINIDFGARNGMLVIMQEVPAIGKDRLIKCLCDCGNNKIIKLTDFSRTKSCGCYNFHKLRINIGEKFNKLTIISDEGIFKYKSRVKCQCECGNIKIINTTSVINGVTKSCGCLQKEKAKSKDPWLAEFNSVKRGAIKRGFEWKLTVEQFENISKQNCYYCKQPPGTITHRKTIIKNGIDRVNNNLGYIPSNCVTCCKQCNLAKNVLSLEHFKQWIDKIYHNFIKK